MAKSFKVFVPANTVTQIITGNGSRFQIYKNNASNVNIGGPDLSFTNGYPIPDIGMDLGILPNTESVYVLSSERTIVNVFEIRNRLN